MSASSRRTKMHYVGGCACGSLRYESKAAPLDAGYCHCRLCQTTSAAPALVFASFPVDAFRYMSGTPAIYISSPHGSREFCASCGTQIAYRDVDGAVTVDVNAASLDDPASVTPEYHIWCENRIPWFDTADDLPRYDRGKPNED